MPKAILSTADIEAPSEHETVQHLGALLGEDGSLSDGESEVDDTGGQDAGQLEEEDEESGLTEQDDEGEGDPEQDESDEDADAEDQTVTGADLAKLMDLDETALVVGDDGKVRVRTKVDGQEGVATLAELVKSHQLEKHLTARAERIAAEQRTLQEGFASRFQELQGAVQSAVATGEAVKAQLLEGAAEKLEQLRAEDPGEAALYQQDLARKINGVDAQVQSILEKSAEMVKHDQERHAEQYEAWLIEQRQTVISQVPAWDAKLGAMVRDDLMSRGFTAEELQGANDARFLVMAHDAAKYRELKQKVEPAKAKARKALKVLPGGSAKGKVQVSRDRRRQALRAVAKTGSDRDAAGAFLSIPGFLD